MRSYRGFLVGVVAVLGILVAWFVLRPGEAPSAKPSGGETALQATPPPALGNGLLPATPTTPVPMATVAVVRRTTGGVSPKPDAAMAEAMKVHRMIVDYNTLMGENPVGTNAEIMRAMTGGNPHQATLGPPEGQTLNDKGELVDPWGTPYFFHQLSRDHMEIHSAGPDRIMGTADDVVIP